MEQNALLDIVQRQRVGDNILLICNTGEPTGQQQQCYTRLRLLNLAKRGCEFSLGIPEKSGTVNETMLEAH